MKHWYRCFAIIFGMILSISSINMAQANDIFFIDQQNYGAWILSRSYNKVAINNTEQSSPLLFQIQPYRYLMTVKVTLPKTTQNPPAILEMDIGSFMRNLDRQDNSMTYMINLENSDSEEFINALKNEKAITISIDDDHTIDIATTNIDKAIDAMVEFAKDHYILMPYPFSMRLDEFASMPIPDAIPAHLYPVFRLQAAYDEACHNPKDKNKPDMEACKQYENVIKLINKAGYCRKEQSIPPQIIGQTTSVSYTWEACQKDPSFSD
ncbi:MAG: hypothetical protein ACRCVY_04585 [Commensalibacter sp.]